MKRQGKGLQRRTPLRRGDSGLKRTPFEWKRPELRAVEGDKPAKPGKRKPAATNDDVSEAKGRKLTRKRSDGWCELRIPDVCLGRAHSFSHRKKRSQGGTWSPSNGMDSCGDGVRGCHGAITDTKGNRAEYERNGWIVGREHNPATTPVLLARPDGSRDWYLLDALGDAHLAPWPEQNPTHPDDLTIPETATELDGAA